IRMHCVTRSPPICCRAEPICASSRNCWDTRRFQPPPSIPISTGPTCARCTRRFTRAPDPTGQGVRMRFRVSLGITLIVLGAGALNAGAATVTLPRPGQVGIAVQGGYGSLIDAGGVGGEFGDGPTFAIRLRYRMRYERGIGLSFETSKFASRLARPFDPAHPDSTTFPDQLKVVLSGLDYYQFFGTRTT